jgi:hypothetical protein
VNFDPPCFCSPYVSQIVVSTSMVSGSAPGPAPVCQARFSNSPLTASSWRTCPQVKARRKVPMVEAAATQWPRTVAVSPARRTATSLIHFAPAISAATRADPFRPTFAAPGTPPRSTRSSRSSHTPKRYHSVAGNLRVKEVVVDDATLRDRFVICHNPEQAERDKAVRDALVTQLERMHLVTLGTAHGQVAQRSLTTARQLAILSALDLPEPHRYFEFTLPAS